MDASAWKGRQADLSQVLFDDGVKLHRLETQADHESLRKTLYDAILAWAEHATDESLSKTICAAITTWHTRNFLAVQPDFFVQLSLSGTKLRGNDIFAKSDPMAVVYTQKRDGTLEEICRTEVIMNTLDPAWIGKVSLPYQFEMVQPLVFRLFDVDPEYHNLPVKTIKLNKQEFLGEATCVLSKIVTKRNKTLRLQIDDKKGFGDTINRGTLTVHAEEAAVAITFRCSHLDNKDFFSESGPFLHVSRIDEGENPVPICETELVVKDNSNPIWNWKPICLTIQQCQSKATPLVIQCFDFNNSGNRELIGELNKSVADLEILHRKKVGVNFHLPSSIRKEQVKILEGQLFVNRFCEKAEYSFLDYISSGFELKFMVAVDFTASNPQVRDTLHYIDPSGPLNSYQRAIYEVGEVLEFYDYDKRFHAWGFGGRLGCGVASHCFNLNGSSNDSKVEGVKGIMEAYYSSRTIIGTTTPSTFSPIMKIVADIVRIPRLKKERKYHVLLLITDGVPSDLQEFRDALVKASALPLSVIVLGVGDAEFRPMRALNSGEGRVEGTQGMIAADRGIVHFGTMQEVHCGKALLKKVPQQMLAYFTKWRIKPF